jgi:ribosome-binding ATPase
LDKLVELHASRKTVWAQLGVVDIHSTARTEAAAMGRLREMDAVLVVLPAFGGQDAAAAFEAIRDDLVLADMGPVETRLKRARKDPLAKAEVPALEAAAEHLGRGEILATRNWEPPDLKVFSSLAPITLKPIIVVHNVDEGRAGNGASSGPSGITVSARLEAEVAGMEPGDARELLNAFGVEEPVAGRVIQAVYRSLDLITFFTTGDDESRAWEVRKGATAPEAAGVIHSDIQRGFIRAEVITYEDVVDSGSWDKAKAKGLMRVEGRDYVFQEGDVTHFRFAV